MAAFVCKLNVVSRIDFIEKLAFEQIIKEQWDKPYKYLVKNLSIVPKSGQCLSIEACICLCGGRKRTWLE